LIEEVVEVAEVVVVVAEEVVVIAAVEFDFILPADSGVFAVTLIFNIEPTHLNFLLPHFIMELHEV